MTDLLEAFEGMYSDGDTEIRCYTRKVVRTRVIHRCPGYHLAALHDLPAGSQAVRERAIVEGKWSACYTCADCIKAWKKERGE